MRRHSPESIYWLTFAALSTVGLYGVFFNKYLRMVDLPGHVAQLTMIKQTLAGSPLPAGFEWNLATPYLLGYGLAYPLTFLVPVTLATKIVLGAYIVATPLSVRFLLRTLGSETWWSLLFFVFIYCHPFHHGFYSYLVATPVGIVILAISIRARDEPGVSWRVATVGLSILLLVSHLLVFLIVFGMFGAYVLGDSTRQRPPRALLLWIPAALGFVMWWVSFFDQPVQQGRWVWDLGFDRVLQIGAGAVGDARDTGIGWLVYGVVLLLVAIAGFRVGPRRGPLVMFVAIAGLALTCPAVISGIAHLGWRLSFWVFVGLFALMGPMGSGKRAWVARVATILVLVLATLWFGNQMHEFDREARTFDPVLAAMDREKTLHPLIFDFSGETGPSARYVFSYLHFGGWYYVEKRGLYAGMFRFAPDHLPIVRSEPLFGDNWREDGAYWSEAAFDLETAGDYDYYLLRRVSEQGAREFLDKNPSLEEIARSGPWRLLQQAPPGPGH
jgi:hypothetical protein